MHRTVGHAGDGRSTLLVGVPGGGLSAVLGAVAAALDVSLVHGSDAVPGVPFVPFARVLTDAGVDGSDARTVYHDVGTWLADKVVVVDDTEQLDLASIALLGHAVRAGATVVAGVHDIDQLPPSFADLTVPWQRAEVGPLPAEAVLALAALRLGGDLAPESAAGLLARAAGLPAVVADLLAEASTHGRTLPSGFDLRGFRPGPRSLALRGHRFDRVGAGAAELLAALVLAGCLPVSASESTVAELVSAGLARRDGDRLAPAGDLVVDVVLPQLVPERWGHLARLGLAALPDTTEWDVVRRRLELLSGDGYDDRALVETGAWFLERGRSDRCLDLVADRQDPAALLVRARARAHADDTDAALADLDRAAASTADDDLLAAVAHEWGVLLRERLADHTQLRQRIAAAADRLPPGAAREQLRAMVERRRAFVGEARESVEGIDGQDASTRALSTVMAGELQEARQIMAEAPQVQVGPDAGFERTMRVLVEFLPVVYDGQMALARSIAEEEYRRARNSAGDAAGLWGYNRAKISLHSGQFHHTVDLAVVAGKHLAWRDATGLAMPCLALRAAGLARTGSLAEATELVDRFSPEERLLPRIVVGIARVEGERHRWSGNAAAAADELVRAGRRAIDDGEAYSGVLALDEAFMLDPRPDIAADLSAHTDRSRLLALCAQRADAMLCGDVRAATTAAEELEALPMPGRAAHLWRVVSRMRRDEGRDAASRAALRRADALMTQWALPLWPEQGPAGEDRLTVREWQVARRAATRMRSREIAEDLGLSVRTVDNHLAACFRKLGVGSRDELAQSLDASVAPVGATEDVLDL